MIHWLVSTDTRLFFLLNGRLTHPVLDAVMPALTSQENWYPVLLGLWVALIIWGGRRGRTAAIALVLAVAVADQLTCSVLKPVVGRLRPPNALPESSVRLLAGGSKALSFPSAHASNSFAMATIAAWAAPRFAVAAYVVAALVAYSRVYVGLHYPLDVIAGALLGMLVGRLSLMIVRALRSRWEAWRAARGLERTRGGV